MTKGRQRSCPSSTRTGSQLGIVPTSVGDPGIRRVWGGDHLETSLPAHLRLLVAPLTWGPLHVVKISHGAGAGFQRGGKHLKVSVLRKPGRSCMAFYDPFLMQSHFLE